MVTATFFIPKSPVLKRFKQLCQVSPEIIFGMAHAVVGIAILSYTLIKTGLKEESYIKKYKLTNIIVRPDDPSVHMIKHVSGLDFKK